jgi:hypothetical protein
LGLLSGFQRANCVTSSASAPLLRFASALRSSYLHLLSPTLQLLFLLLGDFYSDVLRRLFTAARWAASTSAA